MGIDTIYSGICTDEVTGVIPPVPVFCDCNVGSTSVCGADLDISTCAKPGKKGKKRKKGLVGEEVTELMIQQATSPPAHCLSRAALILFEYNATYISQVRDSIISYCIIMWLIGMYHFGIKCDWKSFFSL